MINRHTLILKNLPTHHKSILWMLGWSATYTTAISCSKLLTPQFGDSALVFVRCLLGLMFISPLALKPFTSFSQLRVVNKPLMALRVVLVCFAMMGTYFAYRQIPLAVGCAISFTGPLVTTCLSVLILKEKVSWKHWLCILVGYAGVFVIAQPKSFVFTLPVYVFFAVVMTVSLILVITRILSKTESAANMLFYANLGGMALSAIFLLRNFNWPTQHDIFIMCFVSFFGLLSQICYIEAIKKAPVSFASPFEYTRLVIAVPVGIYFFNEIPEIHTYLGASIIIASTFLLSQIQYQKTP